MIKPKKIVEIKKKQKEGIEYEYCVLCHRLTDVPVDQPVSERKTYLSGAGQLCVDCCMELYHMDDLRWMD